MDECFLNIAQGTNDINEHDVLLRVLNKLRQSVRTK